MFPRLGSGTFVRSELGNPGDWLGSNTLASRLIETGTGKQEQRRLRQVLGQWIGMRPRRKETDFHAGNISVDSIVESFVRWDAG